MYSSSELSTISKKQETHRLLVINSVLLLLLTQEIMWFPVIATQRLKHCTYIGTEHDTTTKWQSHNVNY